MERKGFAKDLFGFTLGAYFYYHTHLEFQFKRRHCFDA
jgi:hypothetical protein